MLKGGLTPLLSVRAEFQSALSSAWSRVPSAAGSSVNFSLRTIRRGWPTAYNSVEGDPGWEWHALTEVGCRASSGGLR